MLREASLEPVPVGFPVGFHREFLGTYLTNTPWAGWFLGSPSPMESSTHPQRRRPGAGPPSAVSNAFLAEIQDTSISVERTPSMPGRSYNMSRRPGGRLN